MCLKVKIHIQQEALHKVHNFKASFQAMKEHTISVYCFILLGIGMSDVIFIEKCIKNKSANNLRCFLWIKMMRSIYLNNEPNKCASCCNNGK